VTVQVPVVMMLINPVVEFTPHTPDVEVAYVTARDVLTEAPAKNAGSSKSLPAIAGKLRVWLIFPATNVCVTLGAAT
jgi:hypothetical protein